MKVGLKLLWSAILSMQILVVLPLSTITAHGFQCPEEQEKCTIMLTRAILPKDGLKCCVEELPPVGNTDLLAEEGVVAPPAIRKDSFSSTPLIDEDGTITVKFNWSFAMCASKGNYTGFDVVVIGSSLNVQNLQVTKRISIGNTSKLESHDRVTITYLMKWKGFHSASRFLDNSYLQQIRSLPMEKHDGKYINVLDDNDLPSIKITKSPLAIKSDVNHPPNLTDDLIDFNPDLRCEEIGGGNIKCVFTQAPCDYGIYRYLLNLLANDTKDCKHGTKEEFVDGQRINYSDKYCTVPKEEGGCVFKDRKQTTVHFRNVSDGCYVVRLRYFNNRVPNIVGKTIRSANISVNTGTKHYEE